MKAILCGLGGRMGQAVIKLADEQGISLTGFVSRTPGEKNFANLALALADQKSPQVVIDFSHAELLPEHIKAAVLHGSSLVVATTGHSEENYKLIKEAAKKIPILVAPNTSLGAAVMLYMSQIAAKALTPEIEILDIHHKNKKDAPSGTALALKNHLSGLTTSPINISSMRIGDVIGEHTAYFFSDFERLELTHRVSDRRVFAQGALLAAQFLLQCPPGLYGMADVLKIN